jgi:hypothetical protein
MGTPAELGFAIASIADERNGYLCGIDVLIDGGAFHGQEIRNMKTMRDDCQQRLLKYTVVFYCPEKDSVICVRNLSAIGVST